MIPWSIPNSLCWDFMHCWYSICSVLLLKQKMFSVWYCDVIWISRASIKIFLVINWELWLDFLVTDFFCLHFRVTNPHPLKAWNVSVKLYISIFLQSVSRNGTVEKDSINANFNTILQMLHAFKGCTNFVLEKQRVVICRWKSQWTVQCLMNIIRSGPSPLSGRRELLSSKRGRSWRSGPCSHLSSLWKVCAICRSACGLPIRWHMDCCLPSSVMVFYQSFPSPRLVAITRLSSPVYPVFVWTEALVDGCQGMSACHIASRGAKCAQRSTAVQPGAAWKRYCSSLDVWEASCMYYQERLTQAVNYITTLP
jgi:hypothetical protein